MLDVPLHSGILVGTYIPDNGQMIVYKGVFATIGDYDLVYKYDKFLRRSIVDDVKLAKKIKRNIESRLDSEDYIKYSFSRVIYANNIVDDWLRRMLSVIFDLHDTNFTHKTGSEQNVYISDSEICIIHREDGDDKYQSIEYARKGSDVVWFANKWPLNCFIHIPSNEFFNCGLSEGHFCDDKNDIPKIDEIDYTKFSKLQRDEHIERNIRRIFYPGQRKYTWPTDISIIAAIQN